MHLLTFIILSIYLKYVKVDEITYFTHNGTDYVTDDEALLEEDGYYAYNIEDMEHEVNYMTIRIITNIEFRIAVKDRRRFWDDGIVPYVLSKKYGLKEKNVILEGMEAFKKDTCIRFIPRTKEQIYISVVPGIGCSATIGKFNKNGVKISRGCYKKGIIIHELMHVLGFLHEQSRPDRDSFVKINYANILEKHKKNFDKSPENLIQTGNVSYDYGSIMHYGPFTFAKDKKIRTVIPLQEGVEIGQREDFSKKDLQKINLFYNCKPQGRRRVKRHETHGSDSRTYFNKQESSLPVVVESQYAERRKSVNFGPVRGGGEYSAPVQHSRQVYQPVAYPGLEYPSEERRRFSYPSAAYPKPAQEPYQWPSYSAVEQPKLVYPQAEQPKLLYSQAEPPQIVYPPVEQPKIVYPEADPPRSPNRQYPLSRPAYSQAEYRRENYFRPTYAQGEYGMPYPPLSYPKPAYARPSYTTAGYRRPPYPPPYYRPVEYPSIEEYFPAEKPYTQPFEDTTVLIVDPVTETIATTTEQDSTTVMTTTSATTDTPTPTVTATPLVTTDLTTLQTTTAIDTTTVAETTTVITTEGVTSTTAETTTLTPTSTVAETTTALPTSTVAETTTAVPTSTVAETTTALPTSTVAETTTALPTSTVAETTTALPTSTVAETTTALPTSTVAETTTALPTSTVAETTTALPTSTVAETTTALPTSTVAETTTALPTSTVAETTTALPTSTVAETTTELPTSTVEETTTVVTVETTTNAETNATEEDINNTKEMPYNKYDHVDYDPPKIEYYELQSRGMGGFVSDKDIHSTAYHRIRIFPNIQGRTALRDPSAFWSRGIVPYEISNKYDDQQKGFVLEAMQEFHNKTCVRFVPRRNQASYIFIEPEIKCSATIGRIPGRVNTVKISEGCYLQGTIIHELMHTLGFVHEQNRPDRDQFVIVMFDNIIQDAKKNFRKYTWEEVQDLGVSYDYDSVMHYSNVEFAIDPDRPTLVPLQAGVTLGQRDGFSMKDLIKVNKLYNCRVVQAKEAVTVSPVEDFKKYFQSNIVRLFRNLLRAIQNFKPSKPKT